MSETNDTKIHCNIPNNQIGEEEWNEIDNRMLNEKFSKCRFLAEGETAREVIERDARYLKSVNITTEQIADAMDNLCSVYYRVTNTKQNTQTCTYIKSKEKYGHDIVKYGNLYIYIGSYMGAQTCPFQNNALDVSYHGYSYGSSDVFLYNNLEDIGRPSSYEPESRGKCVLWFNTLLIHMIRDHGFFEGYTQNHRVDPSRVIEVLGLVPGVNYKADKITEYVWSFCSNYSPTIRFPVLTTPPGSTYRSAEIFSEKLYDMADDCKDQHKLSRAKDLSEYYTIVRESQLQSNKEMKERSKDWDLNYDVYSLDEILSDTELIKHAFNTRDSQDFNKIVGKVTLIVDSPHDATGNKKDKIFGFEIDVWRDKCKYILQPYTHVVIDGI